MILTDEVVRQILAVRNTGATNMFAINNVAAIAKKCGFKELCDVLKTHKDAYCEFIMFGTIS